MENLTIIKNAQFGQIRTIKSASGEPLFCLADVCKALDIKNTRDIKSRLSKCYVVTADVSTPIISQGVDTGMTKIVQMNFIHEPNLYRCIFQSRKAEAEKFQDWVFEEVLPQLRKTGRYEVKCGKVSIKNNPKYIEIVCESRKWVHPEDVELAAMERGCSVKHVREVLGGRKVSMPIMGLLVQLAFGRKQSGDRWLSGAEREAAQLSLWGETLMS